MNEARLARVMSAYSRIEGRIHDRQEAIARRHETRISVIERFVRTDWDRVLDEAACRAELADEYARQECGICEREEGTYQVSHSWDVHFQSMEPDGARYWETETAGYQAWYFSTKEGARTYARLLIARFGEDSRYDVSILEIL